MPADTGTQAICFALSGTLVERTRSSRAIVADAIAEHVGGDAGAHDPEALVATYAETFRAAFADLEPEPHLRGMRAVAEQVDDSPDPAAMVETLRDRRLEHARVPAGVRTALDALGDEHRLGVVTDGPREWRVATLAAHDLLDEFDAVVASYEAGAHKPDPAPFDLARERLPADEHVMVGPNHEADVVGAREAGFTPVHHDREADMDLWALLEALV